MKRPNNNLRKNNRSKNNKGMRPLRSLFGDVLPPDYRRKSAAIDQFQAFFNGLTQDPVYQSVQVLNVDDQRLFLAVPSPGLVNYLRLHTRELSGMISGQFGRKLELHIKALPEPLEASVEKSSRKSASKCSAETARRIEKSASGVEDDALREALVRLSRSIHKS